MWALRTPASLLAARSSSCPRWDRWSSPPSAVMASSAPGQQAEDDGEFAAMIARKKAARQALKAALKQLTPAQMERESKAICEAVLQSRAFQGAATLGLYVHCARLLEVDTSLLLKAALDAGKRVHVPLVQDNASNMQLLHLDDLQALVAAPPFGILEPSRTYADGSPRQDALASHQPLDLLVMPGLGFDLEGRRLGRGGGYYDKAVALLRQTAAQQGRPPPLLVALAYSAQLLPEVPVGRHDERVDVVATEAGLTLCTDLARQRLAVS